MRYQFSLIALLATSCWVGCGKQEADPATADVPQSTAESEVGEDAATTTAMDVEASEAESVAETSTEAPATESPSIDYGEWLEPPEGLSERFATAYPQIVTFVQQGQEAAAISMAAISSQIANQQMRGGDAEAAYDFHAQAGKALRMAMQSDSGQLPASMVGSIFYNEACALARNGETDAATAALGDAVENGFSDMDLLESDEDLAAIRDSDDFEEKIAEWKRMAKEKIMAEAKHDLANGESFPFAFTATDIEGNPISLEGLKGKVVIVDFWGTWCPPCRAEIPSFIELQETYGDQGFQMVGLNYERKDSEEANLAAVVDYVQENGINYPCAMGDEETRDMVPEFRGYPTTLFIDRAGQVRMKAVGLHDYAYLDAVVSTLLAE